MANDRNKPNAASETDAQRQQREAATPITRESSAGTDAGAATRSSGPDAFPPPVPTDPATQRGAGDENKAGQERTPGKVEDTQGEPQRMTIVTGVPAVQPDRKLNETIEGGRYIRADGKLQNAHGQEIDEDGNRLTDDAGNPLPKKERADVNANREALRKDAEAQRANAASHATR